MTKLEKLYSIIENSRDVGVKLPKGVLQQERSRDPYPFLNPKSTTLSIGSMD